MDPRQTARELLEFAGQDSEHGRPFADPIYRAIVEGRQDRWIKAGRFYSSCGDLSHWLLFRMGIRAAYVNRDEHRGWRNTQNITLLATHNLYGGNPVAKRATPDDVYETGDILIVGMQSIVSSEHAICVLDHDPERGILRTCEYGQPHGVLAERHLVLKSAERGKGQALYVKGKYKDRQIDSVLRLYDALNHGAENNELTEPETLAEYSLRFTAPAPTHNPK
jgi:hypothetical protein